MLQTRNFSSLDSFDKKCLRKNSVRNLFLKHLSEWMKDQRNYNIFQIYRNEGDILNLVQLVQWVEISSEGASLFSWNWFFATFFWNSSRNIALERRNKKWVEISSEGASLFSWNWYFATFFWNSSRNIALEQRNKKIKNTPFDSFSTHCDLVNSLSQDNLILTWPKPNLV